MNRKPSRSVVIAVVALLVLAVLAWLAYSRIRRGGSVIEPVSQYEVTQIPQDRIPDWIPGDMPISPQATITRNETVTDPAGRSQQMRGYTVARDLADEKSRYEAYFGAGGWVLQDAVISEGHAGFLAERDGMNVTVSLNAIDESRTRGLITVTAASATVTQ